MPQTRIVPVTRLTRLRPVYGIPLRRVVGPKLSEAWVQFHTTDDDKDSNTWVNVTVENDRRTVVASVAGNLGHFPNNSDRGPFPMVIRPEIAKTSLQNGRVTISIRPTGNDTWRFNFFVFLRFSDLSTLKAEVNDLELTQDRTENMFGLSGILREGPPDIGPTLDEARVSFRTNDDDKDHDTHVTVTVEDFNGAPVARLSDRLGHFNDHTNNGPFTLAVLDHSRRELVRAGTVKIRIDPNGHDTWKFNFDIVLSFSDTTILGAGADNIDLSQDNREAPFGIEELVG